MNLAERYALIAEILKGVPGIETCAVSSDGLDYGRGFENETEAKAFYKKLKAGIDKAAKANPKITRGKAFREVPGLSCGSAMNEHYGFSYILETESGPITFSIIRYVVRPRVILY